MCLTRRETRPVLVVPAAVLEEKLDHLRQKFDRIESLLLRMTEAPSPPSPAALSGVDADALVRRLEESIKATQGQVLAPLIER